MRFQLMPLGRRAEPFDDPEWLFELKYDGFRALAHVEFGRCTLVSRSANLTEQIHGYNVHVDRNDVFWMIGVKHEAVKVNFDNARARLPVRGLNVFDDHDLANSLTQGLGLPTPPIPGIFPVHATISFDVEWNGALSVAQIENTSQHFKGTFSKHRRYHHLVG